MNEIFKEVVSNLPEEIKSKFIALKQISVKFLRINARIKGKI